MRIQPILRVAVASLILWLFPETRSRADVAVDVSRLDATSGVSARVEPARLVLEWAIDAASKGRLSIDLRPEHPRFERLEIVTEEQPTGKSRALVERVEPSVWVTVGSRENPPGRPPEMSVFNVFFDNPAKRPYQSFASNLKLERVRAESIG